MACCLFGATPLSSPVLAYLFRPAGTIFKLSLMTMLFNIWSANWQPSFVCACACLATNILSYATCPSTWLVLLNCYFLWTGTGLSGMRGRYCLLWRLGVLWSQACYLSQCWPLWDKSLTFIPQSLPLLVWSALEQPWCIQAGIPTVGVTADGWAWLSVVNKVGQILFSRSQ